MQPFIPPTVTSYDPALALAWGFMVAAIPLALLIIFWVARKRAAVVVSLVATALAFALGSSFIAPLDSENETGAIRSAAVNEWLDENYSQYGGAGLSPYLESGERFSAIADDGKLRDMYFAYDTEQGYRLVALTGKRDEVIDIIPDRGRGDLAHAREKRDAAQAQE